MTTTQAAQVLQVFEKNASVRPQNIELLHQTTEQNQRGYCSSLYIRLVANKVTKKELYRAVITEVHNGSKTTVPSSSAMADEAIIVIVWGLTELSFSFS